MEAPIEREIDQFGNEIAGTLKANIDKFAEYLFTENLDELKKAGVSCIPVYIQEPGKDEQVLIHKADKEFQEQFSRGLFQRALKILWGVESASDVDYSAITKEQLDKINSYLEYLGIEAEVFRYYLETLGGEERNLIKVEIKFSFLKLSN